MNPQTPYNNLPPLQPGKIPERGADFGHQFGTLGDEGVVSGLTYPENSQYGKQAEAQVAPSTHTEIGGTAVSSEVQLTGLESYERVSADSWERPSNQGQEAVSGMEPTTGLESYGSVSRIQWFRPSKIPKTSPAQPISVSRRLPRLESVPGQRVDEVTGEQKGNAYFQNLAQESAALDAARQRDLQELSEGVIGIDKPDSKQGKRLEDVSKSSATTKQIGAEAAVRAAQRQEAEQPPYVAATPPVPSRPQRSGPSTTGVIGAEIFDDEGDVFEGFGAKPEDFIPKTGDARTKTTRTYNKQQRVHE